jgi:hypothetical protein
MRIRVVAVAVAIGSALGVPTTAAAASPGQPHAAAKTIKLTAVVTGISGNAPSAGPSLTFLHKDSSGKQKRVGKTVKHLQCQGTIGSQGCFGGPIQISGVPRFDITRMLWSIPLCTDARKGCPQGARQTTGDMTTTTGPVLSRRVIGHITVHTTARGFVHVGSRFNVTIKLI